MSFLRKTIGSRKGITWIVMLLCFVSEIFVGVKGFVEINLYYDILVAITGGYCLICLGIIVFEKIKTSINIDINGK